MVHRLSKSSPLPRLSQTTHCKVHSSLKVQAVFLSLHVPLQEQMHELWEEKKKLQNLLQRTTDKVSTGQLHHSDVIFCDSEYRSTSS